MSLPLVNVLKAFKNSNTKELASLLAENIIALSELVEFQNLNPTLICEILDQTPYLQPEFVKRVLRSITSVQKVDVDLLLDHIQTDSKDEIKDELLSQDKKLEKFQVRVDILEENLNKLNLKRSSDTKESKILKLGEKTDGLMKSVYDMSRDNVNMMTLTKELQGTVSTLTDTCKDLTKENGRLKERVSELELLVKGMSKEMKKKNHSKQSSRHELAPDAPSLDEIDVNDFCMAVSKEKEPQRKLNTPSTLSCANNSSVKRVIKRIKSSSSKAGKAHALQDESIYSYRDYYYYYYSDEEDNAKVNDKVEHIGKSYFEEKKKDSNDLAAEKQPPSGLFSSPMLEKDLNPSVLSASPRHSIHAELGILPHIISENSLKAIEYNRSNTDGYADCKSPHFDKSTSFQPPNSPLNNSTISAKSRGSLELKEAKEARRKDLNEDLSHLSQIGNQDKNSPSSYISELSILKDVDMKVDHDDSKASCDVRDIYSACEKGDFETLKKVVAKDRAVINSKDHLICYFYMVKLLCIGLLEVEVISVLAFFLQMVQF